MIFNIQRFSIQDGPGIRTTVFMKGCPLRCQWCSNPESWEPFPVIMTRDIKCIRCGKCAEVCEVNAITIDSEKGRIINHAQCTRCLQCARVCPARAIVICGEYKTVEEVVATAERDKIFFQNSGGGVTISGGECCAQGEFVERLLKALKSKGLQTALDTSGYISWHVLDRLIEYADLILYDIKHLDTKQHQIGTGKGNELILANLCEVAQKKRIWLRVPVIANYNDSEEHFYELGKLGRKIGAEKISLLPYHEWGKSKYEQLGKQYTCQGKAPDPEYLKKLEGIIQGCGLKVTTGN